MAALARRLVAHRAGPTVVAACLALLSLPFVALTLHLYEPAVASPIGELHPLSPTDPARWTAAASGVLISALIAGSFGGWLIRRRSNAVWISAMAAWVIAIASVPVIPALVGQRLGAEPICIDSCSLALSTTSPVGAVAAAFFFWLAPAIEPVPFIALVVGFVLWSAILRRYGAPSSRVFGTNGPPAADGRPASAPDFG